MSSIDLLLLGFLMDRKWSAYELASFMEEKRVNLLIKVSRAVIYRNLPKLESRGCLSSETLREGAYPPKRVFSITRKGEKYHKELMHELAVRPVSFMFDFNAVLVNLLYLHREERADILNSIEKTLAHQEETYAAYLRTHEPFHLAAGAIINQFRSLNRALLAWLSEFRASMREHL